MANGTKITSGWSDAYEVDFTAGGGGGDRPIVLSYASSPPFTIPKGGARSRPPARCWTPASGRWSTPACSAARATRRAPRRSSTSWSRSPSRRRCPTNMYVFPVDRAGDAARRLGEVRQGRPEAVHRRSRGGREEPRRLAAGVERRHHPMRADDEQAGRGRGRRAGGPAAGVPRGVLRAPGRRHRRSRLRAGRAPRRRRGPRGARPAAGAPGALVHGLVGRAGDRRHGAARACRSRSCSTGCGSPAAACCGRSC